MSVGLATLVALLVVGTAPSRQVPRERPDTSRQETKSGPAPFSPSVGLEAVVEGRGPPSTLRLRRDARDERERDQLERDQLERDQRGGLRHSQSRWMRLAPTERDQSLAELRLLPLPLRLEAISEGFVGTPYVLSPLGEGEGKDPDPLLRFDAVDCLTFVEQTLALSLASDANGVLGLLDSVRYQHQRSYADRNHLMEAQWLPSNLAKGFLVDLTASLGGADTLRTEKRLTAATWRSTSSRALDLPPERQAIGSFPLEVVPLDKALAKLAAAPTGTLLMVVREDRPLRVTRISHLGFIIHRRRPLLRHASRTFQRVVDEDLASFLERNARYEKWKVTGFAFYRVQAPPAPLPEAVKTRP